MHEPYDEDEEYDDDQYNNDYTSNPYQWYYKFEVGPDTPISGWLSDMLNKWIHPDSFKNLTGGWEFFNITNFPSPKFSVNSWNPDTGKDNTYQYLGSNYQNSPIWKKKYLVHNKLHTDYVLHLQSHAGYTISQPVYYKGMFEILN